MTYIYHYEIAAAALLAVFLTTLLIKPRLKIRRDRAFLSLPIILLTAIVVELAARLVNGRPGQAACVLGYLTNTVQILADILLGVLYVYYMMLLTESFSKRMRNYFAVLCVLMLSYSLASCAMPITKVHFYLDADNVYRVSELHGLLVVVCLLMMLSGCVILLRGRHRFKPVQLVLVSCATVATVSGMLVQALLIPGTLVVHFGCALGVLLVYFAFQAPEYYIEPATGAFNEAGMAAVIEESIYYKRPVYVTAVFLNNFCDVRELNARGVTDELLRRIERGLETCCGRRRAVYQIRDSFYFIGKDEAASIQAAQETRELLSRPWTVDGKELRVSASVLTLAAPKHFGSFQAFLSLVQYFCDKTSGNLFGSVLVTGDDLIRRKRRYDTICHMLRLAITEDKLTVEYQPIISTCDGRFHAVEALLRLDDTESLGYLSPEEFVPIAEQEGLIGELGAAVMDKVCRFVREFHPERCGLRYIHVNLSVKQCMEVHLADSMGGIIRKYGLDPSFFNFEITESANIEVMSSIKENVSRLLDLGCGISLDDFGAGYANLGYLLDFPFQVVKLDKSLVRACFQPDHSRARDMLHNVIRMLGDMDIKIVAEGVETGEMGRELAGLGVQYLQGFLFSRSLPGPAVAEFLAAGSVHAIDREPGV